MEREAYEILGEEKAIVYTIVNTNPKRRKNEILAEEAVEMKAPKGKYLIFLLSKDTAKYALQEKSVIEWGDKCPVCNKEVWPASWSAKKIATAKKTNRKPKFSISNCQSCGSNLLQKVAKNILEGNKVFPKRIEKNAIYKGQRRVSVGERLKRALKSRTNKAFDYLIIDEAHEMQNPFSLQGQVYRELVNVSHKTLIMTGTLTNGYTSSLYYILYPILTWYFKEKGYGFHDVDTFVEHYGQKKQTRFGNTLDKGHKSVKLQELPRTSDRIVSFLSPFTAWVKIEDLNIKMPSYSEEAITALQDPIIAEGLNWYTQNIIDYIRNVNINYINNFGLRMMYIQNNPFMRNEFEIISFFDDSQEIYYESLENLKKLSKFSFVKYSIIEIRNKKGTEENIRKKIKLVIQYPGIQALITEKRNIENSTSNIRIDSIDENSNLISSINSEITEETILPKEQLLINRIKADLIVGRNVLLYSIYNKVAQIDKRLYKVLLQTGVVTEEEIAILPENLQSKDIEKWIEEHPVKILIASPIKLATGLDLVQFPSIKFYETGTNLRVIQQASRRSWRAVGQKFPVTVEFFAYAGIQANLLKLIGKKLRAAATADGRKVDDSQLSAVFDDDKALTKVLNKIADEIENSESSKADFSNIYEPNKLRPLTKLEAKYKEYLEQYQNSQLIDELNIEEIETENFENIQEVNVSKEIFEDISVKTIEPKNESGVHAHQEITLEKTNESTNNISSDEFDEGIFAFADSKEETEEEDMFEIKIKVKGNQYVFDF